MKTEKNRCSGGYFEFNKQKADTSTERNQQEIEHVSSTEKSEVVRSTVNLQIVDPKENDIAQKTLLNIS